MFRYVNYYLCLLNVLMMLMLKNITANQPYAWKKDVTLGPQRKEPIRWSEQYLSGMSLHTQDICNPYITALHKQLITH